VNGEIRSVHGGLAGSPCWPGMYLLVSSPPLTMMKLTVKPASTLLIVTDLPSAASVKLT